MTKRHECDCVDEKTLHKAINSAILAHEIRVAVVSGVIGLALLIGTWHAIWTLRN
jgi:hypothetical protein